MIYTCRGTRLLLPLKYVGIWNPESSDSHSIILRLARKTFFFDFFSFTLRLPVALLMSVPLQKPKENAEWRVNTQYVFSIIKSTIVIYQYCNISIFFSWGKQKFGGLGERWITEFIASLLSICGISCKNLRSGCCCCCHRRCCGRRRCCSRHKFCASSLPSSACRAIGDRRATGKFDAVQRWCLRGLVKCVVVAGLIFRAEHLQYITPSASN